MERIQCRSNRGFNQAFITNPGSTFIGFQRSFVNLLDVAEIEKNRISHNY